MSFMNKFTYDKHKYNFEEIVREVLDVSSLNKIHLESDFPNYQLFPRSKDQSTLYHKKFYNNMGDFLEQYKLFIQECVRPRYDGPVVYQKIPTFRVHFPSNVAVGEWHKDKKYRDSDWCSRVREINYFLPLTTAHGTNTIWVETEEDKGDFKPMIANYGEAYEWNGLDLKHGNKMNKTKTTRVSVDFRVIPKIRYFDSDHLTINTKVPFSIGGYYEECK